MQVYLGLQSIINLPGHRLNKPGPAGLWQVLHDIDTPPAEPHDHQLYHNAHANDPYSQRLSRSAACHHNEVYVIGPCVNFKVKFSFTPKIKIIITKSIQVAIVYSLRIAIAINCNKIILATQLYVPRNNITQRTTATSASDIL